MNPIFFTEAALKHIQHILNQTIDAKGFRLSLKKTGCSGYAYLPEIITEVKESDYHFKTNDLAVFIDPKAEPFIKGVTVDYGEDHTNPLKQKKLIFINPQEKNRCGCGESFTIE